MARVLLTGATGFIGQYVLRALIDSDHEVMTPARNARFITDNFTNPNVTAVEGNFYDPALVERFVDWRPDVIVHLAAIRGDGNGPWKHYQTVNVTGTDRLVDVALKSGSRQFIYCSSVGVYGTVPSRLPADPYTSAEADGFYHKSKLMAEKVVRTRLRGELPFVIMRPTIAYGFGDDGFLVKLIHMVRRHVFPLMRKDLHIHLLDVFTCGDFVVKAIETEIDDYAIVNLADREPVRLADLVDTVHRHFFDRRYPVLLRSPRFVHRLSEWGTGLMGMRGPHISVKLISNDWYYDTSNLENIFQLPLKNTLDGVDYYLKHSFPRNGTHD